VRIAGFLVSTTLAAKAGGADAVSLINTVSSITSVNLDTFSPEPSIDGKGSHGGYCGPAVKPIALNMVAEIARDAETAGMPISGIGGITTWRDAAEYMALGCGNVQVCTAAMTYGFKIVEEMIEGLSSWMDEKGHATLDDVIGKAVPNVTDWQYLNLNYVTKARIDQDACIQCGRCHIACEDTSHQAITNMVDGVRKFEVIDEECVVCCNPDGAWPDRRRSACGSSQQVSGIIGGLRGMCTSGHHIPPPEHSLYGRGSQLFCGRFRCKTDVV